VPSIRGHLRFWWRATRGAVCDSVEKLREREVEIWGDTENPSKVQVIATMLKDGESRPCATLPQGKSFPKFEQDHPAYALFPFQGNARENKPIGKGTYGIEFELRIRCPANLSADVQSATWAWLNFGGIGARTRRGCGALYCKEAAPQSSSFNDIQEWITRLCRSFGMQRQHIVRDWPSFPDKFLIEEESRKPLEAWSAVIVLLKEFRQGEGIGRNPGQGNRPRRSRWPEPEAIRQATNCRLPKHQRVPAIPDTFFPRAEFGLPIIFHFKDQGDPLDATLVPIEGSERMSSPLILKPLMCNDGNAVSTILQLRTALPEKALLKPNNKAFDVRSPALATYPNSPMGPGKAPNETQPRSPSGSALEAFLAFAQEHGFKEVKA